MRLYLILAVVLLALAGLLNFGAVTAQQPAGQPHPDQFPALDRYNLQSQLLRETGVWRWRFDKDPSCVGDIFPAVLAALNEASSSFGILVVYDPVAGNLIHGNCGPSFAGICGGDGIIGCLGRGYPANLTIDINTVMSTYFDVSQLSIMCHELCGHAMATWGEQYGFDAAGNIFCIAGWRDIMNCGPDSRHHLGPLELARWGRTMAPHALSCTSGGCEFGMGRNAGGLYVYYCATDARATRVAILYGDGSSYRWSGVWAPTVNVGCQGWHVEEAPGRCYFLNVENLASIVVGRNDTLAGCS